MSTLLVLILGLVFGGWVIGIVLKLGAISALATLGAVLLGLLYGVVQLLLDIPWNDVFVLFWTVYGFLAVLCFLYAWVRHRVQFVKKYF